MMQKVALAADRQCSGSHLFIFKANGIHAREERFPPEPDAADNDTHKCLIKDSISGLFP